MRLFFVSTFIFTVLFLILAVIFKILSKSSFFQYRKRAQSILIMYASVLFIAVITFYMIPENKDEAHNDVSEDELREIEQTSLEFMENKRKGTLDEIEGVFANERSTFTFDQEKLAITTSRQPDQHTSLQVYFEYAEIDKIEVTHYMTPMVIGGKDMTKEREAPDMSLQQDELVFVESNELTLEEKSFMKEFPITQFTEEERFGHRGPSIRGKEAVYVQIPKEINVTRTSGQVEMIQ
ncbi:hypothetical protein [Texcoconibacillus texcoconensis]|uniref:Uncharacterized protein n=1 Tax=Texcoconibacillus texcoconensis TaxID=1095777 RepID=A0A840QPL5_9BACI|nr:hypothetical protein [Texcoconibacillus texcoconensis]MBB5173299.1 hypothetical protein [Texcoconibacillus texcoconensis]